MEIHIPIWNGTIHNQPSVRTTCSKKHGCPKFPLPGSLGNKAPGGFCSGEMCQSIRIKSFAGLPDSAPPSIPDQPACHGLSGWWAAATAFSEASCSGTDCRFGVFWVEEPPKSQQSERGIGFRRHWSPYAGSPRQPHPRPCTPPSPALARVRQALRCVITQFRSPEGAHFHFKGKPLKPRDNQHHM